MIRDILAPYDMVHMKFWPHLKKIEVLRSIWISNGPKFLESLSEFLVREKLEQELKEKEEEFEKEKQKFAEENPELAAQMEGSEDLIGGDDPQFKAIFDVQNHIQVKSNASQKD